MRTFLILLSICSVAMASKPKLGNPERIAENFRTQPVRYCRVINDGHGHRMQVSDWIPYGGGTRGILCSDWIAYDSFDIDIVTGFPINGDVHCGPPFAATTRWFFGTAAVNPHHISDFQVEPGKEGHDAETLAFPWYVNTPVGGQRCLVAVETWDEVGDALTCGIDTDGDTIPDAAVDGFLDGFVFDFGVLQPVTGYRFTVVDLCPEVLALPADGTGAYEMTIARDFIDSNGDGVNDTLLIDNVVAQPMLWATSHDNSGDNPVGVWHNKGIDTEVQWDDDSPLDGMIDISVECYSYFGILPAPNCPQPFTGSCMAFLYLNTPQCSCAGDFNNDNAVGLADLTLFLSSFGGAPSNPCMDFDNNGVISLTDLTNFLSNFGRTCP